jgi:hypothetical protein
MQSLFAFEEHSNCYTVKYAHRVKARFSNISNEILETHMPFVQLWEVCREDCKRDKNVGRLPHLPYAFDIERSG